jgi:hypothetical protein
MTGPTHGKFLACAQKTPVRYVCCTQRPGENGDEETRTLDLRIANATLSQLSYVPIVFRYHSTASERQVKTITLRPAHDNRAFNRRRVGLYPTQLAGRLGDEPFHVGCVCLHRP